MELNSREENSLQKRLHNTKKTYPSVFSLPFFFFDLQNNIVHVFVLMSDGEDTVNSEETIDNTLDQYNKMIQGSGIQTLVKVFAFLSGFLLIISLYR